MEESIIKLKAAAALLQNMVMSQSVQAAITKIP